MYILQISIQQLLIYAVEGVTYNFTKINIFKIDSQENMYYHSCVIHKISTTHNFSSVDQCKAE